MLRLSLASVLFFYLQFAIGQNITAKVLDRSNREPVAYAAIQIDDYKGTMTNEEGYFSLNPINLKNRTLTISCLGYSSKTITLEQIQKAKNVIFLDEAVNQLAEVYLSNKKPNADSIIAMVRLNLSKNYNSEGVQQDIFYRETTYTDFEDLDLEIEKASYVKKERLQKANKSLDSLSKAVKDNRMIFFKEFKGNILSSTKDSVKLKVEKATKLIDIAKDFSIESIQDKAQQIVLQYLDADKTYKLKSGWFTVEDEMSLEDLEKDNDQKDEYQLSDLKSGTKELLRNSQFYSDSFLNRILDPDLYEYKFISVSYINNELIYMIDFKPDRSKSKFAGRLYINDKDYAIIKSDYAYSEGKRGSKLNLKLLLGVKYIENLQNGTIIFRQDSTHYYQPHYIKEESGSYFYVSRPLKFIENSLAKNKVSFDFVIEGNLKNKKELLFSDVATLNTSEYVNLKEEKTIPFALLSQYDSSIWQNTTVIEPLEEMKEFKSTTEKKE